MPVGLTKLGRHRHGPFFLGSIAALICLPLILVYAPRLAPGVTAIVFFLIYLVMMARRIPRLDSTKLKNSGQDEDAPALAILAVTLLAVVAAIISLFDALNADGPESLFEVAIAFGSVVLGWFTIHTMFALHYAHLYWRPSAQAEENAARRGGLDFPETDSPAAYDFMYFSFNIGMTAQTSDVDITTSAMRRVNLMHAIASFFFNTVLVAAAVNAIVSMGS